MNTFERLVKTRCAGPAILEHTGPALDLEPAAVAKPIPNVPMYVPCPDCGQLMNRKNFGGTSGVIVDVCKSHGIWFDRDELGRIMTFVMNGGLEAARRHELERIARQTKGAGLTSHGATLGTTGVESSRLEMVVAMLRALSG